MSLENLDWSQVDDETRAMIASVFDADETIATFLEECARQLRDNANPHRIAHYLNETAENIRAARARVMEKVGGQLEPEPKNALRSYLSRPPEGPPER